MASLDDIDRAIFAIAKAGLFTALGMSAGEISHVEAVLGTQEVPLDVNEVIKQVNVILSELRRERNG